MTHVHAVVGHDQAGRRSKADFYPTPEYVTRALLEREEFNGSIWEPACGDGAISKLLPQDRLISTDLHDRGYGEAGIDFLSVDRSVNNIITNPPFLLAEPFIHHALACADQKVAMLLKLNFLEGIKRYREIFSYTPLKTVYIFSSRISFDKPDGTNDGRGLLAFAWYIWEHGYEDKPRIDWIA